MISALAPVLNYCGFDFSLDGQLLGEGISTQLSTRFGGVIPSFAMGYHAKALPKYVPLLFLSCVAEVTH